MPNSDPNFTIRPYAHADDADAVAFLRACARDDPTISAASLEEWQAFTRMSFNQDAKDFKVACTSSGIAGLLTSTRLEAGPAPLRHVRILVHPAHRRRGLGTQLCRTALEQDRPAITLQANCLRSWEAGRRLLQRLGCRVVLTDLWMGIEKLPPPVAPGSRLEIVPYAGGEAEDRVWREINDAGYFGGPDFHPLTADDQMQMRREPGFRLWFAQEEGVTAALCHAKTYSGGACINSLVVAKAARRRGLGRALLTHALHAIRRGEAGRIRLSVREANTPALGLYRSMGFVIRETTDTWWLDR